MNANLEPPVTPTQEALARAPTLDDLPQLESLTLADFAGHYEHVAVPEGRTATDEEIKTAVDQFLSGFSVGPER